VAARRDRAKVSKAARGWPLVEFFAVSRRDRSLGRVSSGRLCAGLAYVVERYRVTGQYDGGRFYSAAGDWPSSRYQVGTCLATVSSSLTLFVSSYGVRAHYDMRGCDADMAALTWA